MLQRGFHSHCLKVHINPHLRATNKTVVPTIMVHFMHEFNQRQVAGSQKYCLMVSYQLSYRNGQEKVEH